MTQDISYSQVRGARCASDYVGRQEPWLLFLVMASCRNRLTETAAVTFSGAILAGNSIRFDTHNSLVTHQLHTPSVLSRGVQPSVTTDAVVGDRSDARHVMRPQESNSPIYGG